MDAKAAHTNQVTKAAIPAAIRSGNKLYRPWKPKKADSHTSKMVPSIFRDSRNYLELAGGACSRNAGGVVQPNFKASWGHASMQSPHFMQPWSTTEPKS